MNDRLANFFSISLFILILLSLLAGFILIINNNTNIQTADSNNKEKSILKIFREKNVIKRPGVSIVTIYGPISITVSSSVFNVPTGGSDYIINQLDKIEKNKLIKAVVLRINSPGGTIGSVQEIYAKLQRLRKKKIKIVTSMGDIAASGGYYLACASDMIVANPGTLTGSIGVIIGGLNYSGLLKKIGIKQNIIKSGKHKDILAGYRNMTQEERDLLQNLINSTYNQFFDIVYKSRKIPKEKLKTIADGRIFDGTTAKKLNLVDELGSLEDAIRIAKKLAKLPSNAPVYKETYSPINEIIQQINSKFQNNNNIYNLLKYNSIPLSYLYFPGEI